MKAVDWIIFVLMILCSPVLIVVAFVLAVWAHLVPKKPWGHGCRKCP